LSNQFSEPGEFIPHVVDGVALSFPAKTIFPTEQASYEPEMTLARSAELHWWNITFYTFQLLGTGKFPSTQNVETLSKRIYCSWVYYTIVL
jgi:hypothetical protein